MKRALWMLAVLAAVVAVAAAAWFLRTRDLRTATGVDVGTLPRGVPRDRLNLVIVTLDTTRADRIGAYGSREVETPAIDRLAHEGVLFEQAVSVAPLTLPAHSSIFTGKFPPEHGVRDNGGFFLGPEQTHARRSAQGRAATGPAGSSPPTCSTRSGASIRGSTPTSTTSISARRAPCRSARSSGRPTRWWTRRCRGLSRPQDRPFFAWIHLYDAHSPVPAARTVRVALQGASLQRRDRVRRHPGRTRSSRSLQSCGLYDRTVVVVMGDHGESLGDHGESAHGFFVYNSVTHVPFVIRTPFSATRSIDASPIRCDRWTSCRRSSTCSAFRPPAGISGVSLAPLMTGAETRAGARRVLGSDVSAPSLRLERSARAAVGPLQGHRRAAAGAVRHRPRSARSRRTSSPNAGRSAIA